MTIEKMYIDKSPENMLQAAHERFVKNGCKTLSHELEFGLNERGRALRFVRFT